MAPGAPLVQADKPGNLLLDGWVRKGDAAAAFAGCAALAEATFETGFVGGARFAPGAGGGACGGTRDLSGQPLVGVAAWRLGKPVACVYTRPESMASSTKRHPSRIAIKSGCDAAGKLVAIETAADCATG